MTRIMRDFAQPEISVETEPWGMQLTALRPKRMITIIFIAADARSTWATGRIDQSFMEAAAGGVDGIAADCGGLMTCATCHVFVRESFAAQLQAPASEELSMLAFTALAARPNSRRSCEIRLTAELDGLTVELLLAQY